MRIAIYYSPSDDDPLTRTAARWLGRDAYTGETFAPRLDPEAVASPRRYGFHATVRAPFSLADGAGLEEVERAVSDLSAARRPVVIEQLALRRLGRFLALVPAGATEGLGELERDVLSTCEPFRRPLRPDERARRKPETLTERQGDNLDRWGYPYVLDEYRFHMTLTNALAETELSAAQALAETEFAPFLGKPRPVDRLAIFTEREPGADFEIHSVHPFGGHQKKTSHAD